MSTAFASASSWSLPRAKVLRRDEMSRILGVAKERDARDYVFFAIAVNTGLRLSEVLHLTKDDLIDGQLRIVRRKKKVLKHEMIDLVDGLWETLSEWGQMFNADEWLFPGHSSPCFITPRQKKRKQVCNGGHASKRTIQRRWDILLTSIDLKMRGRGIHTTRHHAVTAFYEQTRDLRAAQVFAGHSSSQITERYAHVVDMRDRIKKMEPNL